MLASAIPISLERLYSVTPKELYEELGVTQEYLIY